MVKSFPQSIRKALWVSLQSSLELRYSSTYKCQKKDTLKNRERFVQWNLGSQTTLFKESNRLMNLFIGHYFFESRTIHPFAKNTVWTFFALCATEFTNRNFTFSFVLLGKCFFYFFCQCPVCSCWRGLGTWCQATARGPSARSLQGVTSVLRLYIHFIGKHCFGSWTESWNGCEPRSWSHCKDRMTMLLSTHHLHVGDPLESVFYIILDKDSVMRETWVELENDSR